MTRHVSRNHPDWEAKPPDPSFTSHARWRQGPLAIRSRPALPDRHQEDTQDTSYLIFKIDMLILALQ